MTRTSRPRHDQQREKVRPIRVDTDVSLYIPEANKSVTGIMSWQCNPTHPTTQFNLKVGNVMRFTASHFIQR